MIFSTKSLAQEFESYIKGIVLNTPVLPVLHIIQIGDDFASSKYIDYKKKKCNTLGIKLIIEKFGIDCCPAVIEKYIETLKGYNLGIMIQLPVPAEFAYLVTKINPNNDIDLLGPYTDLYESLGKLTPTIGAIDLALKKILDNQNSPFIQLISEKLDLTHKKVAVIGQGKLVGKPLLSYLQLRGATIISINKDTKEPEKLTKMADIIITAAGIPNLLNKNWIDPNCIVIDAATVESQGALIGDVDRQNINEDTLLCPSPGGIGRLTILYLIFNLLSFNDLR
jgi:methylenetetrahydrofolate dehydrogenase (NADP+) / methenyltetrahydrofolate cyclohydrolase